MFEIGGTPSGVLMLQVSDISRIVNRYAGLTFASYLPHAILGSIMALKYQFLRKVK